MVESNYPEQPFKSSVVDFPKGEVATSGGWFYTYPLAGAIASVSERIPTWGTNVAARDAELRNFHIKEPWLAGAVYSIGIRNAAYQWEVEAKSKRLEKNLYDLLNGAIAGTQFGWLPFIQRFTRDLLTTDNGAFIELIRDPGIDVASKFKNENAPIIGIGNLDSIRCMRTGNPQTPVVYLDRQSKKHKLKWYEVIAVTEDPSPIETMYGVGYSAVTKIMTVAQVAYTIHVFQDEKISGRQYKAMHFVSGVSKAEIQDTLARGQEEADNRGQIAFIQPAILASLDPEKPVSTDTIELAAFPNGFDYDEFMRWYITSIALNTGSDYQDLAPLPSGQMSGAGQSEVLHRKSRGKGPAFFMETIQNIFRDYGIIPKELADFRFVAKDLAEEMERAEMGRIIAETGAVLRRSDILDGPAVREWYSRTNAIDEEIIQMVPEDLGAGEFGGNNETMVGQIGNTTAMEDAARSKNLSEIRKTGGGLFSRFMRERNG